MSTATDLPRPATGPDGTSHARPTPVAERALAPDLARGMLLLLIAMAHVPWFLFTSDIGITLLHPADGGVADRIAQALTIIVVDARTHTMFAFLFAYGIGQLYARQRAGGTSERDARRLLRTRHLWLLGFGLVHAALLWQGDILGTYGLMGLLLVPLFLHRSDRTLTVWIGILLGILASRHRVLDEPSRHLPLLRRTAIVGIAVGWGAGIAQAMAHVGLFGLPNPAAFGAHLSSRSATLVAVGSWLLTVVVAYALDRAGIRGPAETLLQTLTYRAVRRTGRETAPGSTA